ncbi:hypothetical protein CHU98_g4102 [Xylaria longipes]|nr:hypothetical protein CHU98_g4102 [Xylaria longipes]
MKIGDDTVDDAGGHVDEAETKRRQQWFLGEGGAWISETGAPHHYHLHLIFYLIWVFKSHMTSQFANTGVIDATSILICDEVESIRVALAASVGSGAPSSSNQRAPPAPAEFTRPLAPCPVPSSACRAWSRHDSWPMAVAVADGRRLGATNGRRPIENLWSHAASLPNVLLDPSFALVERE